MVNRAQPIRILCVDDHEFLTDGLAARINLEPDMSCVGSLSTADDLIDRARDLSADVVILDLEMPGSDSLETLSRLKKVNDHVRVIVLSAHVRDHYIDQALQNGADGYFSKNDPPSDIIAGVRRVIQDETAFGGEVEERLDQPPGAQRTALSSKLQTLSPREMEVLRLVGKGLSRADIARQLVRSLKTIDAHHTSIMRKLDIHDRAELTRYAILEGVCES